MNSDLSFESVRLLAQVAGLKLSEDELQRFLVSVNRAKKQAGELREIVAERDEPGATFRLEGDHGGK